jgi:hypothetical protein
MKIRVNTQNNCFRDDNIAVASCFALSIMNPSIMVSSGLGISGVESDNSLLDSDQLEYKNFFGNVWESGNVLTDNYGQVTGYGPLTYPETNITNVFHKNYIDLEVMTVEESLDYIEGFNPETHSSYFPLIYFIIKFRNTDPVSNHTSMPANTFLTTKLPFNNSRRLGTLTIYDSNTNISSTPTGLKSRILYSCPLFGGTLQQTFGMDINLTPAEFWSTSSGIHSGILT